MSEVEKEAVEETPVDTPAVPAPVRLFVGKPATVVVKVTAPDGSVLSVSHYSLSISVSDSAVIGFNSNSATLNPLVAGTAEVTVTVNDKTPSSPIVTVVPVEVIPAAAEKVEVSIAQ